MTRIVVLGGYGAVGRAVARTLTPTLPGRTDRHRYPLSGSGSGSGSG